jgi:hypothetical protein
MFSIFLAVDGCSYLYSASLAVVTSSGLSRYADHFALIVSIGVNILPKNETARYMLER